MAGDIGRWLEELGLGKYVDVFANNEIDLGDLPHLGEDDFKELGLPMGPRKRLLAAIAELAPSAPASEELLIGTREAERRQLTVMFVDLVGSTALSAKLDPEDLREVMRLYQDAVAGAVTRYTGHVAKYLGDGVLAFFGWPQAHEDQAERAVRAGLDAVAAVSGLKLDAGIELRARAGIATGQVVIGDLVGEAGAVSGETPNLAARLQEAAEAGEVVIGSATRRLIGEAFELVDLGSRALKGFAEAVPMWRVTRERAAESRFGAAHAGRLTAFVGREEEVNLLVRRWQQANGGEGQVVLLSGEAGIGKSRIAQTLRDRTADQRPIRLRLQCSPYHANSALYPFISHLEQASRFASADGPEAKLDKLEELLAQSTEDVARVAPLFGALLSVPSGDRYPALELTPQLQKERTLEALADQILGLAARRPVLMIFEDVHWADPTTLEALELIIDRVQGARVLGVITFRPEFAPPWHGHTHMTALALNRLGRDQCAAMVPDVARGKALPGEVLDQIVAKTDGVPLFVEELTKTVIESGILEEKADRYELTGPLPPLAIPSTLQDSLMARLDRLAQVKEVAQLGAAIGREFSHRLLAEVSPASERVLGEALGQLVESELVFRRGRPPDATYVFKHALVQDVAYESLLRSKRQALHQGIARALEESFPETAETEPDLLSHHYTEADLAEPEIEYWQLAGQQAVRRAANLEAIQHFQKALDLLQLQPESSERNTTELAVLTHLGPALMLAKGWAAIEVGTAYERARKLAGQLESSADLVPPLVGMWLFHTSRGQFDLADEVTQELFHVAKTTSNSDLLLQAHHAAWPIPMLRGAFATANEHIEKGLALYDYEQHKHHAFVYLGHDPAVCAHGLGAGVVWALGFPDRAHRHVTDALQLARRLGHAPTLAFALWTLGAAHAARGDEAAALSTAEELLRLSEEQKLVQTAAIALIIGGWALAQTGQTEEGLERMRAGLGKLNQIGVLSWLQLFTCLFAESLLYSQRRAEALENLDQALDIGEQTGERWWESRIHHLRGQALLHSGDADSAAASLQTAIQIARAQDAKSWELRAATSLARLWAEQGKRNDARDLLAPIYSWFTEGFGTPDLKDAKALLDELA